jgi:hypothetical protein
MPRDEVPAKVRVLQRLAASAESYPPARRLVSANWPMPYGSCLGKELPMMRRFRVLIVFAAIASVFALLPFAASPAGAQGAQAEHENGYFSNAVFTSTNGCLVTTVNLNLGTRGLHLPGENPNDPYVELDDLNIYDACVDQSLLSAFYRTSEFTFDVASQLASATLVVNDLPLLDCGGALCSSISTSLDVIVTWTATGPIEKEPLHFNGEDRHTGGMQFERPVIASGTITDGTTNYAPASTADARLAQVTFTGVTT